MITKLSVYDMDGTLMDTPLPDSGKEIWKQKTEKPYPHVGWWGRKESLSMEVFDIKPFPSVLAQLNADMAKSDTLTVILTSRIEKLRPYVEEILNSNNIKYDDLYLKNSGLEKDGRVQEILNKYPDIKEVNLYDDRQKEFVAFQRLRNANPNMRVNIFKADKDRISIVETVDKSLSQMLNIIDNEIGKLKS